MSASVVFPIEASSLFFLIVLGNVGFKQASVVFFPPYEVKLSSKYLQMTGCGYLRLLCPGVCRTISFVLKQKIIKLERLKDGEQNSKAEARTS